MLYILYKLGKHPSEGEYKLKHQVEHARWACGLHIIIKALWSAGTVININELWAVLQVYQRCTHSFIKPTHLQIHPWQDCALSELTSPRLHQLQQFPPPPLLLPEAHASFGCNPLHCASARDCNEFQNP